MFGRLGSLNQEPSEGEEDWEDLDEARAAEIERKKKILKGQLARAAVRSREQSEDLRSQESGTFMPTAAARDVGRAASQDGKVRSNPRRTSLGRTPAAKTTPNRDPTQKNPSVKRKGDDPEAGLESRKGQKMAEEGRPPTTDELLRQMKGLMEGLGTQMVEVRSDIKDVRNDLSEEIAKGARATDELRRRMDDSDATFADRVVAVIRGQDGVMTGPPALSMAAQSSSAKNHPGDDLQNGGLSYAACAGLPLDLPSYPRRTSTGSAGRVSESGQ